MQKYKTMKPRKSKLVPDKYASLRKKINALLVEEGIEAEETDIREFVRKVSKDEIQEPRTIET